MRGIKKKLTYRDRFARKYYCEHARLNSVRFDKKQAKRKMRRIDKMVISEEMEVEYNV